MSTQLNLNVVAIALLVCHVSVHAQDPLPDRPKAASQKNSVGVFDNLKDQVPTDPSESVKESAEFRRQDSPRDPTEPSARLLERVPRPAETSIGLPTVAPPNTRQSPKIAPLPALPKISLRGMVMNTSDRGTAMLNVDGKSVTISLLPKSEQYRIPIPAMQFASMQPALEQRSKMLQKAQEGSGIKVIEETYEMCLQCSFVSEDIVFNLEAFTSESLLLRAVPHNSLILVRKMR